MGKDHKETLLKIAHRWHSVLQEEAKALSKGDLNKLDRFVKESHQIQLRLEKILTEIDRQSLDKEIIDLMKELREGNEQIVAELSRGRNELLQKIGSLRKNKTSVKGYKQTIKATPRLINSRP